nr:hypothetical protein [Tanacetum cinerariifolium]
MHEMRKNYNNRGGNQASKNDDTPMCERHEANYIQSEDYQNQNSYDSFSHQSFHDPNDPEKSLKELNNYVKNDLEDFKRRIRSIRTVHWKLFARDDGKTTGLLMKIKQNHPNSFNNTSNFDSNGGDDGVINGSLDQRFFKPLSPKTPIPSSTHELEFSWKSAAVLGKIESSTQHSSVNDFGIINIPEEDVEPKQIILAPDDQPMWESAKTVAPTPSSVIIQLNVDDNFVVNTAHLNMIRVLSVNDSPYQEV